ncbi:MAG TPA: DUF748 domain-containing protein [Mariprofundaceae bacterium]|nr:DUF748 domain-containing protein [Mariprofundaceae bacterium]
MIAPRRKVWRNLLLAVFGLFVLLGIFVDHWLGAALAPLIEKAAAQYQLDVTVKRIDTRLYSGSLALKDISLGQGTSASRISHLFLEWSWHDLLHGDIRITRIRVEGANILPLPAIASSSSSTNSDADQQEDTSGLPVKLGLIEILNSRLTVITDGRELKLGIPWLRLEHKTGRATLNYDVLAKLTAGLAPISGEGLNLETGFQADGSIALNLDNHLQLSDMYYDGKASIEDFHFDDGNRNAKLKALRLDGRMDVQTQDQSIKYAGRVDAKDVSASDGEASISADNIVLPIDLVLAQAADALNWRIGPIELAEPTNLTLTLREKGAWQRMTLSALTLSGIDSKNPGAASDVTVELALGEHKEIGLLKAKGQISPLVQPMQAAMDVNLDLEAAPFSSVVESALGLSIQSGRLALKADAKLEKTALTANTHLNMKRLRVVQADAGIIQSLQASMGLAPDAALDLLRDSDDRIQLDIPVSAKLADSLSDIQADLSSVYSAAMAGALKKAALGYVKNLFQPYGAVIDAVQWLGEQSKKLRLPPIFFDIGKPAFEADSIAKLDKIASFLKPRPKTTIAICGVVSGAESKRLGSKEDAWMKLAGQRTSLVMDALMAKGVARDQLTLCQNRLDDEAKARPRVEVLL